MNRDIDQFSYNMLFDEKMGDTVHLAVGRAYGALSREGNDGNESAVHVDMIVDMSEDSLIEVDGEVVQRDGTFVFEDGFEDSVRREQSTRLFLDVFQGAVASVDSTPQSRFGCPVETARISEDGFEDRSDRERVCWTLIAQSSPLTLLLCGPRPPSRTPQSRCR